MADDTAIEMFVGALMLDPNTQAPVVILKDESGELALPIWIGIAEATSIASAIKQVAMARPLTHDLMNEVFQQLGVRVDRVVITELKEATYFAELVLTIGEKAMILDSRPSDAIAVALRASAPIFVAENVLSQAKVVFGSAPQTPQGGSDAPAQEEEEEQNQSQDFSNVSKEKWEDLLESLDPDDFKYKM